MAHAGPGSLGKSSSWAPCGSSTELPLKLLEVPWQKLQDLSESFRLGFTRQVVEEELMPSGKYARRAAGFKSQSVGG